MCRNRVDNLVYITYLGKRVYILSMHVYIVYVMHKLDTLDILILYFKLE